MEGPHNWWYWSAVAGATVFRVLTSISASATASTIAIGAFGGVFCAVFFTDPLLSYLNASPDTYKAAIAAVLTLTGEGLLRLILAVAKDPSKIFDLYKTWKSGK